MEQNLKTCPYCGEEIMATAKKCKHCGEWLEEEPLKESTDVAEIETEEDEEDYDELADTVFDDMYSEVDVHTPNK
jgi:predicted ATP-dependent serine protease